MTFLGTIEASALSAVGSVESALGFTPAPSSATSAPSDVSDLQADLSDVTRWKNVLTSRDKTTPAGSRPQGSQTSAATSLWNSGIGQDAIDSLSDAIDQGQAVIDQATVSPPSDGMLSDFSAAKLDAQAKYQKAVSQAQQITALFDADAAAIASGVSASDFTPSAILAPAFSEASTAASNAAAAIKKGASAAVSASLPWLPYATAAAAAALVLGGYGYLRPLFSFLPNPRRRRAR